MAERPLLILPSPTVADIPRGFGGGNMPPKPQHRIEKFREVLGESISYIETMPYDIEITLVIETIGKVQDFHKAVTQVQGLEWLAEVDLDEIDIDEGLYDNESDLTKARKAKGRLYLISSNRSATDRLLGLWNQYHRTGSLPRGRGKWKNIFAYINDLRRWSEKDRIEETGVLEYWQEEIEFNRESNGDTLFEIELHYRADQSKREEAEHTITQFVNNQSGHVIRTVTINEIAFHAMKISLPILQVKELLDSVESGDYAELIRSDSIRYIRPIPQQLSSVDDTEIQPVDMILEAVSQPQPVIALLDGMPLANHTLLEDRLTISDPDGFASSYTPDKMKHGTAMASLICHGDLDDGEQASLSRRIYVQPVMQPNRYDGMPEEIPSNYFPEDLVERAVVRMFEEENDSGATFLSIRVINISLGNLNMPFLGKMSSWGRLLDYLSWKYKVLFIVSAGNYAEDVVIPNNDETFMRRVVEEMGKDIRNRKILSPAESINSLTVGAIHADKSQMPNDHRVDIMEGNRFPAEYSRLGAGFRRGCKPDILVAGGRQLFTQTQEDDATRRLKRDNRLVSPGQKNAYTGHSPEDLHATAYTRGTSNAAALTTHAAGRLYEVMQDLRSDSGDDVPEEYEALVLKALLVHGASWGGMEDHLQVLKVPANSRKFKRYISQYLGYGEADFSRVMECTAQRVTAIGYGALQESPRHRFVLPIPSTCQGIHYYLTVTLAYFCPINPVRFGYRGAKLFFECPQAKENRLEADHQLVRGGTVQHEILELTSVVDEIEIFVQCRADANDSVDEEIPYALCLTLEAKQEINIDIYNEINQEIRTPIATN